jgi:hypothetical protein
MKLMSIWEVLQDGDSTDCGYRLLQSIENILSRPTEIRTQIKISSYFKITIHPWSAR